MVNGDSQPPLAAQNFNGWQPMTGGNKTLKDFSMHNATETCHVKKKEQGPCSFTSAFSFVRFVLVTKTCPHRKE